MQISEFIENVCKQIKYKPIRKDIAEELTVHIREIKEEYISNGIDEEIAEENAISHMGNPEGIGKILNKIHKPRLDYKLLLIEITLLIFGLMVSIIRATNLDTAGIEGQSLKRFMLFTILGFIAGLIVYFIDYNKLRKYSKHIYIFATVLSLYTLFFGIEINGMTVLYLKAMSISPSIIILPLYIISFIGFIEDISKNRKKDTSLFYQKLNTKLIEIIVLSFLSIAFLVLLYSFTAAIILFLTYLIISTIKILNADTNKKKYILQLYGFSIVFIILIIAYMINNSQLKYNKDVQIQEKQGLIISMSNLYGKAEVDKEVLEIFDEGTNYAIISILAHYGWIITISMILTVILLWIRLISNSSKIKEQYGRYLIIGISSMFIFQSIFSILMNFCTEIKGEFYLPFVSWGGINLVINMMCLGLMLSIYRRKDILVMKETMQLDNM